MSKRNKALARGKGESTYPLRLLPEIIPGFQEHGRRVPAEKQDKQGGLRSKVNLILRNKAVNEETESEPRVEWPPKGRKDERKGKRSREDTDRWEKAKRDEKGDEADRRRRRKWIGVASGAKND